MKLFQNQLRAESHFKYPTDKEDYQNSKSPDLSLVPLFYFFLHFGPEFSGVYRTCSNAEIAHSSLGIFHLEIPSRPSSMLHLRGPAVFLAGFFASYSISLPHAQLALGKVENDGEALILLQKCQLPTLEYKRIRILRPCWSMKCVPKVLTHRLSMYTRNNFSKGKGEAMDFALFVFV